MKKYLILLLLVTFAFSANAQDIKMSEVIETNVSKDLMWINLKKWISSEFNSYDHVVDLEDKENGIIIIKWKNPTVLDPSEFLKLIISSTIEIDIKDNKFRYIVSDGQVLATPNIDDPSRMTTSSINLAENDINFFLNLIGDNEMIIIDEDFKAQVNYYKQEIDNLPKYKNEKKNKLSYEWEMAKRKYEILKNILVTFNNTNQALINSLKESLTTKDDW